MKPKYEDLGEIPIDSANDANIPVSIWLVPAEDDDGERIDGLWELRADNYMPRKSTVSQDQYRAQAKDRAVLVGLVHKHWLPLYQTAIEALTKLEPDEDGVASLYYWKVGD